MQCKQELRSREDKEISQNFEKEHILHRHSMYNAAFDDIHCPQGLNYPNTRFKVQKDSLSSEQRLTAYTADWSTRANKFSSKK